MLDILKRELAAVLGDYALLLNDNIQKQEKEAATREKINRAKLQLNQSREFLQTLYENLMNGVCRPSEAGRKVQAPGKRRAGTFGRRLPDCRPH